MMDAPGTEPALRDLEATALAEQHVSGRDPDIFKKNFGVAMRRLVIAKDRQHPLDDDAGMRERHQYHRLPPITVWVVGIRLAHHDHDLAARIERPRGPPFATVDDVIIGVAADPRFDVGRVRGSYVGLGHREGRADFAGEQRIEPTLALLHRAVAHQDFHVAGTGAEQLNTSGAHGERPMISQSGAYSRLVSPAPYSLSGKKRFHSSAARAFAFNSSRSGTGCHRSPSLTP